MIQLAARLGLLFGGLLYVALLDYSYTHVISPEYSYMGYISKELPLWVKLFSWFMAILPCLWMPIRFKRPSQIVYWVLYITTYVPMQIIPYYTLSMENMEIALFSTVLLFVFLLLGITSKLPLIKLPRYELKGKHFWLLISTVYILFYFSIAKVFGLKINLISLTGVYEVRDEYKEILSQNHDLLAYFIGWQADVINPLIIIWGLVHRRVSFISVGIVGQLLLYSITGFKSVLFSTFLLVAILITLLFKGKKFGLLLTYGSSAMVFLTSMVYVIYGNILPVSLFVRRMLVTPGLLSGYYLEFFSSHSKVFLSHSIFNKLSAYPFDLVPPYLIGYFYFNDYEMSANANLWADSYANFGYIGMVIFTIILIAILLLLDSAAKGLDYRIAGLMISIPAFSLSNAALLTSILSHGIALTILLIYLLPRKTQQKEEKDESNAHYHDTPTL